MKREKGVEQIVGYHSKTVADKIVTLIKGMNDTEQERLFIFIQGANFVKGYDSEHKSEVVN